MFAMPGLALNVFAELSLSGLAMGTEAHPPATKATTTMQNPAILLNIDSSLCLKSIVSSCCDSIFYEEARVVKSGRGGRAGAGRQTRRVYPVGYTRSSRKTARRATPSADLRFVPACQAAGWACFGFQRNSVAMVSGSFGVQTNSVAMVSGSPRPIAWT